jgi:hypothetical protein
MNSSTGPENWPAQWQAKALALHSVDWPHFRRDPVLMELIESSVWDEAEWRNRAEASGLDPAYLADSLYGYPPKTMEIDGYPVTATSIRMACYAKTIYENWHQVFSPIDVLEIGGGFGAMAWALWSRFRLCNYLVLDAECCLEMQREFTRGALVGIQAKKWQHNYNFDLAINTHSFGEMDPDDVAHYFGIIKEHLRDGGALYTQNRIKRTTDFEQYPYGDGWRHVLVRHPRGKKDWVECLSVRDRSVRDTTHPIERLKWTA